MTTDTTKAPHCPRCGGEMVRAGVTVAVYRDGNEPRTVWTAGCLACGFPHDRQPYTHKDEGEVIDYARRLVRAELARQALEMRAHSHGRYPKFDSQGTWTGAWNLGESISTVAAEYEWLGTNPLRLPGEEA